MSRQASDDSELGGTANGAAWLNHLAHDLRGPLSPLAMAVSLLQTGRAGPAQQPELYALMQRQIECLTQLLDDTADLLVRRSRPVQAVDVASLLDMLKIKFARRLRANDVNLEIVLPAAPPPVLGEMRDLLRLVGELVLRCADVGGRGCHIRAGADDAAPMRWFVQLVRAEGSPDPGERLADLVSVLQAPVQSHVADAVSAEVLRRYGIGLAVDADGAGFVLDFPPPDRAN